MQLGKLLMFILQHGGNAFFPAIVDPPKSCLFITVFIQITDVIVIKIYARLTFKIIQPKVESESIIKDTVKNAEVLSFKAVVYKPAPCFLSVNFWCKGGHVVQHAKATHSVRKLDTVSHGVIRVEPVITAARNTINTILIDTTIHDPIILTNKSVFMSRRPGIITGRLVMNLRITCLGRAGQFIKCRAIGKHSRRFGAGPNALPACAEDKNIRIPGTDRVVHRLGFFLT